MCFEARFRAAHDLITSVASANGCTGSNLINSVSRHVLPRTASFTNLAALFDAAQQTGLHLAQRSFVATSGESLIFSCKFDGVSGTKPSSASRGGAPPTSSGNGKKRKREAEDRDESNDERLVSARKRLAQSCAATPLTELDTAQTIVQRAQKFLRGPNGEIVLESYALMTRKLQMSDVRSSVIVALRINAGIPVAVAALKKCLGSCWRDGVVSSEPSVNGVCEADLPLSEEGAASKEHGNAPMLIVTSVPLTATTQQA